MRFFLSLSVFVMFSSLMAALPPETIVFEAESMSCDNQAWTVKQHFTSWYGGMPSGGNFLEGHSGKPGEAVKKVKLASGNWSLWIRYLDLERLRTGTGFRVSIEQNGKTIAEREFDTESLRKTAAGKKKWGGGFGQFVWDQLEFNANAGEIAIKIRKNENKTGTAAGARHLDVFVLTTAKQYEPQINDLYPLYVKAQMLAGQTKPVVIHVFGRRSSQPWYIPHLNINKEGVFEGVNRGAADMKDAYLEAGDASPWIDISRYLSYHGNNALLFNAMENYHAAPEAEAAFELSFSKTPDDKGIFFSEKRQGGGNGMIVNINLVTDTIVTDRTGSEKSLEYARATAEVRGTRPAAYPFLTTLALNAQSSMKEYVDREQQALTLIGINGLAKADRKRMSPEFQWYMGSRFFFHRFKDKCLGQPDIAAIDKMMQDIEDVPYFVINLMDEPALPENHVVKCANCIEKFPAYLEKQGIMLDGKPSLDKQTGALYYWTMRYRNHLMAEALRVGTEAVRKYRPELPTTVNFATELVYNGNMLERGVDWFEILGSDALTYGWHEDWANHTGNYQIIGYQSDVMRAACRPRNRPFGIYNIMAKNPWDIQAKGFTEIGHGNKAMHFFSYGPWYGITSDAQSGRPEIYQAVKEITLPSGEVDQYLVEGSVARGDAAQLLSVTSDIWNDSRDNIFGKERIYLNLLLRHCNYRLDILSEDDLSSELRHYKMLFVTDSHIRKAQLQPLMKWLESGGTLYLGAGALEFDENNEPLNLPFKREKLHLAAKAGRAEFEMPRLKVLKEIDGVPVVAGYQDTGARVHKVGKGSVIFSGFFPGVSYQSRSKKIESPIYSLRDYPEAHRRYIGKLNLPVSPRLITDNYRIEANLIESPEQNIIVLANWTGEPQKVQVTLDGRKYHAEIKAGGYILCSK